DQVLGEAAVVVVAHRLLVRAHGEVAPAALLALGARDRRDHLHPVTRGPPGHAVADRDDLPGDLVPHHPGRADVVVAEPVDLGVGAAGGAVADPDLHLSGAGHRLGGILQADVPWRVESGDLHDSASSSAGWSRRSTASASVASRSRRARSGSSRIWASSDSSRTCPSPLAAMPTHTSTRSPSQSTPPGKR